MLKHLILRSPDGDPAGGDPDPDTKPKPGKSASQVAAGGKTPREIALEKQVSTLEDEKAGFLSTIKELTGVVDAAKNAPGRKQGGSILDDIFDFVGFREGAPEKSGKKV